jgi:HEAT repeat protein
MRRIFLAFFAVAVLACFNLASGQDGKDADKDKDKDKSKQTKEKQVLGKTIGEWITMLRENPDPKKRWAAIKVLDLSEAASTVGFAAVLDAAEKDKDVTVRIEAIKVMGRFDPKMRPAAVKAIVSSMRNDKDGSVREAAASILGSDKQIEKKVVFEFVDDLIASLKDTHEGTRAAVAISLRNMGEAAKPAVPALIAAADDAKELSAVRVAAVHVVSRYGKDNSKMVPLLIRLAKDTNNTPALREIAMDGLGRSGSDANEVVSVLTDGLAEKNVELRKAAAVSLGTLGAKAKPGWPAIKEQLAFVEQKNSRPAPVQADSSVRNHLIRLAGVLGKTTPEAVTTLIASAKFDDSTENRIAAIQELGELGALAKAATADLTAIAQQDGRAAVRDAAAKAVKSIGAQ